ncbi:FK506-binding protein 5-like isoform X2 [Pecten maximus]|uniref:FK506-binding protein 5-like isoform X2 n=1 Tax=Pecten maximus TaxID=6579 RepID=UPI001457F982|nr:FK506-binding protein 5-like isoform X2 [Pecten maximus]
MSESDLNEFLDEIQGYIENTPNLSILIKKRYDECSKSYIHSSKFEDFLHITRAKIDSDNSRVFVHLRDFLNELKSNKAEKKASKKRKRRESGSNNSSGAPSPKSIRDNSTDQDTDGSVVENDEAFREVLHNQQPNSVSKPSLNHQTPKREAAEIKIVESNTDSSRSIENRDCESLSQKGSNEVSDTEEVKNHESNMETDINQESNVETDINQESIVETDRNQESNVETDRNQESNVETDRNQESNVETDRNQESNVETDRNQESLGITSVKEEASAISDGDGGLCMTVKDECVDIDPQSKIENVDKSKENSDVSGGFVSDSNIDCITIDDDDDDDDDDDNQNDDDKLVIKEPTKEMKTEDIRELHKEKDAIDSPKTVKCEHSNDENDQGGKTSCTLKEKEKDNSVEVESKAEICDAEVESKAEICEAEVESKAEICDAEVESKAEICDAEVESKAEICDAEVESKTEILDAVVESKAEFCDDAVESKAEIPDAVVESKAEICDEDEKKSVNKTSETVREDLAKGKNYVETKQIENQQTYSSSKFAEVGQEDNKNETAHTVTDEGTSSKSTLPLANKSSEPNKKGSQRQIRRLENLLEDIRNKIEELKNADLSLDALGDEDSVYIQEDRYQHKFVKVWRKLCELKGAESTTGRPIERRFFYKGTRYPEVNRKLEKFVNKHKIFPDFHDVQKVIRDTSKQKKLGLSGPAVDRLAREAFQDIGDLLQKRRISDLRKTSLGHLQDEQGLREDPASKDPDLKKKLDENRKVGKGKLDEVLEKFCKWQEETPEDENVDKKSEEDEEDKEEMEMFVKDDVPEMIKGRKSSRSEYEFSMTVMKRPHHHQSRQQQMAAPHQYPSCLIMSHLDSYLLQPRC